MYGGCVLVSAPLQIDALEKPKNYEQIMSLLQDLSTGYQRGESTTGRIQFVYISLLFLALSMICLFISFALSNDLIRGFSKIIRFPKFVSAYTIVPLYCCLMILSMSLYFGYEAKDAITAVEKAEQWRENALRRIAYLETLTFSEVRCSIQVFVISNLEAVQEKEKEIFGDTLESLEIVLEKHDVYKSPSYSDFKVLYVSKDNLTFIEEKYYGLKHSWNLMTRLFKPIERGIRETFDELNFPTTTSINITRSVILIMSIFTVFYTILVWSIIALEIKNTYPFIIKLIQYTQPVVLLFILIEYFLIWNLLSSTVNSYSTYSKLITTDFAIEARNAETWKEIHAHLNTHDVRGFRFIGDDGRIVESKRQKFIEMIDLYRLFPYLEDLDYYKSYTAERETSARSSKEIKEWKDKHDELMKYNFNMNSFLEVARFSNAFEQPELQRSIQNAAKSYTRYLSYFNEYTFVPIASPGWRIVTMPVLMFFNLIFIVLAIPLIKRNSREASSEAFI